MLTAMEFPYRYIQGPGALKSNLAMLLRTYGQKVLVVCDPTADTLLEDFIFDSENFGFTFRKDLLKDECTQAQIHGIDSAVQEFRADCIVAIGGPQLLDAAKVSAGKLRLPIIISPLPVACESTCSDIAVVYSPDGTIESYMQLEKCIDVIIVDLELLVKSPARFLVSAMGSTLAVWFEAECVRKAGLAQWNGFLPSCTAYDLAWSCYENLLEYGHRAKLDCEAKEITVPLERIVETITLLNGICFSNIGVATAHAVYNGLTVFKQTGSFHQGEKLALAALVSLYVNKVPAEIINDVYRFCASVGLPVSLEEIGFDDTSDELCMRIAKHAGRRIQGMPGASVVMNTKVVAQALVQVRHDIREGRHLSK